MSDAFYSTKPNQRSRFASNGLKLGDPFTKGVEDHSACHGSGSFIATQKGYIMRHLGCKTTLLYFLRTINIELQQRCVEADDS